MLIVNMFSMPSLSFPAIADDVKVDAFMVIETRVPSVEYKKRILGRFELKTIF
jgi:hypothetical protein